MKPVIRRAAIVAVTSSSLALLGATAAYASEPPGYCNDGFFNEIGTIKTDANFQRYQCIEGSYGGDVWVPI